MRRTVLAAIIALAANASLAQTQRDLNEAEGAKFDAADKILNARYARLMSRITPAGQGALRKAQRAWMDYRDAACAFDTLGTAQGSIHPMEVAICLTWLTRQRANDLKAQIDCEEGDVSCGGQ